MEKFEIAYHEVRERLLFSSLLFSTQFRCCFDFVALYCSFDREMWFSLWTNGAKSPWNGHDEVCIRNGRKKSRKEWTSSFHFSIFLDSVEEFFFVVSGNALFFFTLLTYQLGPSQFCLVYMRHFSFSAICRTKAAEIKSLLAIKMTKNDSKSTKKKWKVKKN